MQHELNSSNADAFGFIKGNFRDQNGDRHNIYFMPKGQSGRRVQNGPMVPGPWASAAARGIMIDGTDGGRSEDIHFTIGDVFVIDGYRFLSTAAPNNNIYLLLID